MGKSQNSPTQIRRCLRNAAHAVCRSRSVDVRPTRCTSLFGKWADRGRKSALFATLNPPSLSSSSSDVSRITASPQPWSKTNNSASVTVSPARINSTTVSPSVPQYDLAVSEPLISETHRLVTSTPDSLEVASAKDRSACYNHTFINFICNLWMKYSGVSEAISGFIERHEKRSWRLHVTGFKIRTCWRMKREMSAPPEASSRAFPTSSSTSMCTRRSIRIRG